jgi:Pyruvate/2-oxoacid:ferredoxin oxidoreductase delta subunit/predicted transcriptional regulator
MDNMELYKQLAESVGAGESLTVAQIFKTIANENEAKVLLTASPPATIEEISQKTGIAAGNVEKMMDPLFKKGLIFKSKKEGPTRYYRVRRLLQFHDSSAVAENPPQEMLNLWKKYMTTEFAEYRKKTYDMLPAPFMRVIPVNVSIEPQNKVMAFDDIVSLLKEAKNIAVTKCSCRVIDGSCGKPVEVCIQIDKGADYAIERGTGKKISKDEAVDMIKQCEEEGLVHISGNIRSVSHVICNCCEDCCMNWPVTKENITKYISPSRFQAVIDQALCTGCEACMDRCYFNAISAEDDDQIIITASNCMGCGLCAVTCPEEAITLKEVRSPDFVPG